MRPFECTTSLIVQALLNLSTWRKQSFAVHESRRHSLRACRVSSESGYQPVNPTYTSLEQQVSTITADQVHFLFASQNIAMAVEDEESSRAERREKLKKLNVELAQDGEWQTLMDQLQHLEIVQY